MTRVDHANARTVLRNSDSEPASEAGGDGLASVLGGLMSGSIVLEGVSRDRCGDARHGAVAIARTEIRVTHRLFADARHDGADEING